MQLKNGREEKQAVEQSQTTIDALKICKWAKKNGAVSIKVGGVEILFPPPEAAPFRREPRSVGLPPNLQSMARGVDIPETVEFGLNQTPAINSTEHPDAYSRDLDLWANQTPLPKL